LSVRAEQKFPIVVLTSSRARSDAVRSLFRGADRVLVKPNSFDELEDILDEVIRGL
jgi:DNA-binding response OmpR family regulator